MKTPERLRSSFWWRLYQLFYNVAYFCMIGFGIIYFASIFFAFLLPLAAILLLPACLFFPFLVIGWLATGRWAFPEKIFTENR